MKNTRSIMIICLSFLFCTVGWAMELDSSTKKPLKKKQSWIIKKQVLTEQEAKLLWKMYIEFLEKHYKSMVDDLKNFKESSDGKWNYSVIIPFINQLTIELPFHELRQKFNDFGVIQLRYTNTAERLLVGCGNKPIINALNMQYGTDNNKTYTNHVHTNYITVNPELFMNPTVVAFFGSDNLDAILPKNYFNMLVTERTNPLPYNLMLVHTLKTVMQNSFEVHESDALHLEKTGLERFDDSNSIDKKTNSSDIRKAIIELTQFDPHFFSIDSNLLGFADILNNQHIHQFFSLNLDQKLQTFIKAVNFFKIWGKNYFIKNYDISNEGLFEDRSIKDK